MTGRASSDFPAYIYGTTRLGDGSIQHGDRVALAREVLDRGLWVHTSDQYGDALDVLGAAVRETASAPSTIVKVGGGSASDVRASLKAQARRLGVSSITFGQLSPVSGMGEALAGIDPAVRDDLRALKSEGLVGGFLLEIFPWTSESPLRALRAGYLEDLIDGVILYLNPLQRFASNELWDELRDREIDQISMRTVAGGDIFSLRDEPGAAWRPYLQERATQVAPIFERSGASSWVEFCARFALGTPGVRATVGSTSSSARLEELLDATRVPVRELPVDVIDELLRLQRRWADETDAKAEPWTM